MVSVKKLYDLNPHVEWLPFLNEVFNPAIRVHQHTQVTFIHSILSEMNYLTTRWQFLLTTLSERWAHLSKRWRLVANTKIMLGKIRDSFAPQNIEAPFADNTLLCTSTHSYSSLNKYIIFLILSCHLDMKMLGR